MNLVKSIHEAAMEHAHLASVASAKGDNEKALMSYNVAFELEKLAAFKAETTEKDPISKTKLLRSAAALADKAKRYMEGEKLLQIAYAENPPDWLRQQLLEIEKSIKEKKKKKAVSMEINGVFTHINAVENEITIIERDVEYPIVLGSKVDEMVRKYLQKAVKVEARKTAHGLLVLEKISLAA